MQFKATRIQPAFNNAVVVPRGAMTGIVTLKSMRSCPALVAGYSAVLFTMVAASPLHGQTDYYNTDQGRPILIEDAYPVERYAFELQFAPLRIERHQGGSYAWGVEPEIAYGIFPRTQIEVGLPLHYRDAPTASRFGVAGLHLSVLHNLNVETRTLPALGVAAEAVLPVGSFAPEVSYLSAKGILTRTYRLARFHVNGRYTFGELASGDDPGEFSRWMAGIAVDRALPLRSMLITGELYTEQPLVESAELEWNAGGGVRYQWSPHVALDLGGGKRFTGAEQGWFMTFGAAYAFAIRSLLPGQR